MRLRNIPEAQGIVDNSRYVIHEPETMKGRWKKDPARPLILEIGMGKGRFIIENASAHPEADYIGIERYASVLFRACLRMEGVLYSTPADKMEREQNPELFEEPFEAPKNLHFLSADARNLPDYFGKGEVDGIFLNFSDPWPKARHAKRRLTSREFLSLYEQILADGGFLEFKTDNRGLFDFSVEEIREKEGWELLAVTYDLHHDPVMNRGNIMTEYERKFSNLGNKICRLQAVWRGSSKVQKS